VRFAIDRPVVFFSCPLSTEQEALRLFARELARTLDDPLLTRTRFSGWREAIDSTPGTRTTGRSSSS